ncbi:MAG TPA: AmmeMemoRadiSam system protein A [Usitatibacter sp.]|nr:AmmeMemoRadiSam system protein A [Usitatibacter sp.]
MAERERRGRVLLGIAREALADGPNARAARQWDEEWLRATAASFVTLREGGELRGCIGTVDAHRPLGDDVAHNARAAAYRDPRFPPVTADIRDRLEVEVSVLSARVPIEAASEAELVALLRPGVDGLVLEYEELRATFLPQVWESLPDPVDFLAELRRKAGLPVRFWHPRLAVSRYTVEKYR